MQPGMNFYSQLPDTYSLVVNTEHPLVAKIKEEAEKAIGEDINKAFAELGEAETKLNAVNAEVKDHKPTDEQQKQIDELQTAMVSSRTAIADKAKEFASKQPLVRQLIDLALLSTGMLRGRELSDFVNRSVSLL